MLYRIFAAWLVSFYRRWKFYGIKKKYYQLRKEAINRKIMTKQSKIRENWERKSSYWRNRYISSNNLKV